jgi:hypothetical protein
MVTWNRGKVQEVIDMVRNGTPCEYGLGVEPTVMKTMHLYSCKTSFDVAEAVIGGYFAEAKKEGEVTNIAFQVSPKDDGVIVVMFFDLEVQVKEKPLQALVATSSNCNDLSGGLTPTQPARVDAVAVADAAAVAMKRAAAAAATAEADAAAVESAIESAKQRAKQGVVHREAEVVTRAGFERYVEQTQARHAATQKDVQALLVRVDRVCADFALVRDQMKRAEDGLRTVEYAQKQKGKDAVAAVAALAADVEAMKTVLASYQQRLARLEQGPLTATDLVPPPSEPKEPAPKPTIPACGHPNCYPSVKPVATSSEQPETGHGTFTVVKCPSEQLAYQNCAFVSKRDYEKLNGGLDVESCWVDIEQFTYTCCWNTLVKDGTIALNDCQRKECQFYLGRTISVERVSQTHLTLHPLSPLTQLSVVIEPVNRKDHPIFVNEADIEQGVRGAMLARSISTDQGVYIRINGYGYVVQAKGLFGPSVLRGVLTETTKIHTIGAVDGTNLVFDRTNPPDAGQRVSSSPN